VLVDTAVVLPGAVPLTVVTPLLPDADPPQEHEDADAAELLNVATQPSKTRFTYAASQPDALAQVE